MDNQLLLVGRSVQTPVENKNRREVTLPGAPSKDFVLTARCRIVNVRDRLSLSASDLPGETGGSYTWSSASSKIRLVNTAGPTLAVEALDIPSASRDAEVISVTRTGLDGSVSSRTVAITIARITFKQSSAQKYGHDDFDTPSVKTDDHVCIESDNHTFLSVTIEGGAVGTDFEFACDDPSICTIDSPPALTTFDLCLRAKSWQKRETVLRAKAKCPSQSVFAVIAVHVYSQRLVKVLVAKVADNSSPATALTFATADYAAHQSLANDKLKEAVVKYEISNFDPKNGVTNIAFDVNKTGALPFDINADGGPGVELISKAVTAKDPEQYRVVIVRDLRSYYYLDRAAKKGDTSISVRGKNVFKAEMPLGQGSTQETVKVIGNTANVAQLASPLTFDHAVGEPLEFPAAAWSTDPIIISEGSASLNDAKWTILHEVGHSALQLQDIVDATDFMNFEQGNSDYRLRYCPRVSQYDPGVTENQWERIPRPLVKPPRK
jgi:hypothetical protein